MNESRKNEMQPRQICILKTDTDRYGSDISSMSDFFTIAMNQSSRALKFGTDYVSEYIQPVDLGIISETIQSGLSFLREGMIYIPDFEHLPEAIKDGLKSGRYIVAESKQIDGNFRAVIVDTLNNNQRVKDVTLKKIVNTRSALDSISNITVQLQLKKMSSQLMEIREIQEYQLQKDRDTNIKSPFLQARNFVRKAESEPDLDEQNRYLKKADEFIQQALINVYLDMDSSAKAFAKKERLFLIKNYFIKDLMNYLQEDFLLALKFTGFRYNINCYLQDEATMNDTIRDFRSNIKNFIESPLTKKGESAINLLHKYYPYTNGNNNAWFYLPKQLTPILDIKEISEYSDNYMLTLEDN